MRPTLALQGNLRRLPLSPKQAGKEYYKGNRVGSMGTINRFGNFTPDWSKIRTFVYPIHGTKNSEVRTMLHSPRRLRRARLMIEAQSRLMPPTVDTLRRRQSRKSTRNRRRQG